MQTADTAQKAQRVELPSTELIFGSTAGMREIREKIERAAHDNLPVLIEGEIGTGKEVIGRFLHESGLRGERPFFKVNCGAASARMLERELFGFDKTTGAKDLEDKGGSVSVVAGGTLFLDEINMLDSSLQQKLAHTFGSGLCRRIEAREDLLVNARFVCATKIDREAGSRNNIVDELRECFVHRVRLLPLRDRTEDIPQLSEYLLGKLARDFGRPVPRLSLAALEALQQRRWRGNIRELENWIARIVIFGTEEAMSLEFSRQPVTWEEPRNRDRHSAHLRIGRAKRLRRHS